MSIENPTPQQIEDFCLARQQGNSRIASFRAANPESKAADKSAYRYGSLVANNLIVKMRMAELDKIGRDAAMKAITEDVTQRKASLESSEVTHDSVLDRI